MTTCEICKSPTLGVTICDDCYSLRSIDISFAAQWSDTRKTYAMRRRAQFGPSNRLTKDEYDAFVAEILRRVNAGFGVAINWRDMRDRFPIQ